MAKYMDQFLDPGMDIDPGWTPAAEDATQRERLCELVVVAQLAEMVPRRLGGDATPAELKVDKRLCRQIANRLLTVGAAWGLHKGHAGEFRNNLPENHRLRQMAAQVNWQTWWTDTHKPYLQNEARRIATHAAQLTTKKVGNRLVHRVEFEWKMLDDILGELDDA